MQVFIIRILITMLVVIGVAHWIPGLEVKDFTDLMMFGLILGIVNAVVRPIIFYLTLPITLLTLGLFTLVINGFTFWLASEISYGVRVTTLAGAFWGGFAVWITGLLTNQFLWSNKKY